MVGKTTKLSDKEVIEIAKEHGLENEVKRDLVKSLSTVELIREYEDRYNPVCYNGTKENLKIKNYFKDQLKIADNIKLDDDAARKELDKFFEFINSPEFMEEYGRPYNFVDIYLTTNLTMKGLCIDYVHLMSVEEIKALEEFIKDGLSKIDNKSVLCSNLRSKENMYLRFTRPAEKRIYNLLNLNQLLFSKVNASKEDMATSYQILLDLNEKYGVKYDEISYHIVVRSYLNNEIDSYYKLGEKYKKDLDEKTHVQVRCIPTLTRRENNE